MAWHLRHVQGEISAYDSLAITNFYMGRIEKSDYYIDRVFRGKTEAMFSVIKRISLAYTNRKFKNVRTKPFKADMSMNMAKTGAMTSKNINNGILELFSNSLQNYNILSDEILRNLGHIKK